MKNLGGVEINHFSISKAPAHSFDTHVYVELVFSITQNPHTYMYVCIHDWLHKVLFLNFVEFSHGYEMHAPLRLVEGVT